LTDNSVRSEKSFPERMAEHDFGPYDFRNDSLTPNDAYRLGKSLSDFYETDGKIIVGNDHRKHSEPIKDALIDGLIDYGSEVKYIGLGPTDLVAHQVLSQDAEGGVAVTASHMPPEYRGLKPLNKQGRIFDEKELEEALDGYEEFTDTKKNYNKWLTDLETENFNDDYSFVKQVHDDYISDAVKRYDELFDSDLSGLSVAVDPGNGVGSLTLPRLLNGLGVEENDLYIVNQDLDPEFPGRGSDPTDTDLQQLKNTVDNQGADLGIALDGDADRAVFVNENAEKVLGDESLAILSAKYLEEAPDMEEMSGIVCSANTSQLLEDWITGERDDIGPLGTVNYQPVGAVFTAKTALYDKNIVFGGQPNGHLLDPEFVPYDSGTLTAGMMAGVISENNELSQLQDELPSYNISKTNWEVDDKQKAMKALKQQFNTLDTHGVHRADITKEKVMEATGANDKILFRPSGNEPVIRITLERRSQSEMLEQLTQSVDQVLEEDE